MTKTPHPETGNSIPGCELYFYIDNIQVEFDNGLTAGTKLVSPVEDRNWATKPGISPTRTGIFWLLQKGCKGFIS